MKRRNVKMFTKSMTIAGYDDLIADAIKNEENRQETHIELIASENYTSPRVMEAQGSYFTNKYAEGYPGKRYYGGCEFADVVEQAAIDRAKELYGADYANVQPHSGSACGCGFSPVLNQKFDQCVIAENSSSQTAGFSLNVVQITSA